MTDERRAEGLDDRVRELEEELARARVESARLQRSAERYRDLVSHANAVILRMDMRGRVTFANDYALNLFGYTRDELVGRSVIGSVLPEDNESAEALVEQVTRLIEEPGRAFNSENVNLRRDGVEVWVSWTNRAVADDMGRLAEILCVGYDITAQKKAEEALRLDDERLQSLLELSRMTGASVAESTDFLLGEAVRLTGSALGYLVFLGGDGEPSSIEAWSRGEGGACAVDEVPVRDLIESSGLWKPAAERREPLLVNDCREGGCAESRRAKEALRLSRHLSVPVFAGTRVAAVAGVADKEELYVDSDVRQLTLLVQAMFGPLQLRRAERERARLQERLQQAQKMEAIGTLAGGIAHDFNNILSPIMVYTEMALETLPSQSEEAELLRESLLAARRARDLARQILTFSRATERTRICVLVQPVLKEATRLLRASLPASIEIRQEIDPDAGPLLADPTEIHQILVNLGTNAYQAMRDTGGILAITVDEVLVSREDLELGLDLEPGPYLRLSVSDTGHGMSEEIKARAFEPYFTTKEQGEGTGLGLSVVHGIVRSMSGEVRIYSEEGQGTTFHVYLPVADEAEDPSVEAFDEGPVPRGTERILLVDDEVQIVRGVRTLLSRLGYRVTGYTSSVEALAHYEEKPERYDLVLTDLTMPALDGLRLARRMLEMRADQMIVLCTGFSAAIKEREVEAAGIAKFLVKPLLRRELATALREVLD